MRAKYTTVLPGFQQRGQSGPSWRCEQGLRWCPRTRQLHHRCRSEADTLPRLLGPLARLEEPSEPTTLLLIPGPRNCFCLSDTPRCITWSYRRQMTSSTHPCFSSPPTMMTAWSHSTPWSSLPPFSTSWAVAGSRATPCLSTWTPRQAMGPGSPQPKWLKKSQICLHS